MSAVVLLAACGGKMVEDGSPTGSGGTGATDGRGGASGATVDSGGGTGGNGASGRDGGDSTVLCPAQCVGTTPVFEPLDTFQQVVAALPGAWLICGSARDIFSSAPDDVRGVEFERSNTGSAHLYYLVAQSGGGLERGSGRDYLLGYSAGQLVPSGFLINMTPTNWEEPSFDATPRYSPCPTMLELSGHVTNIGKTVMLVPVPPNFQAPSR